MIDDQPFPAAVAVGQAVPRRHGRGLPVAHLEELRDTSIPIILRLLERREAVLKKYMAEGEEQTRQAQNELGSVTVTTGP